MREGHNSYFEGQKVLTSCVASMRFQLLGVSRGQQQQHHRHLQTFRVLQYPTLLFGPHATAGCQGKTLPTAQPKIFMFVLVSSLLYFLKPLPEWAMHLLLQLVHTWAPKQARESQFKARRINHAKGIWTLWLSTLRTTRVSVSEQQARHRCPASFKCVLNAVIRKHHYHQRPHVPTHYIPAPLKKFLSQLCARCTSLSPTVGIQKPMISSCVKRSAYRTTKSPGPYSKTIHKEGHRHPCKAYRYKRKLCSCGRGHRFASFLRLWPLA